MTPEVRAIADRFMYETATLKHILALLPEGALDRQVPGYQWQLRQLLAHLGHSLHIYREPVERWLRGEDPLAGLDPDTINGETAAQHRAADLASLKQLFDGGIVGLVAALEAIPDGKMSEPFGPTEPVKALRALGGHAMSHAIALVDAVPEIRMDPLVLNWLLYADFEEEPDRQWQRTLLAEAREYVANQPEEADE